MNEGNDKLFSQSLRLWSLHGLNDCMKRRYLAEQVPHSLIRRVRHTDSYYDINLFAETPRGLKLT